MKPASMTAAQIAALLAEMEIDSDPAYDMRKREQLAWAFARRLYGDEPSRRAFVRRVNPDVNYPDAFAALRQTTAPVVPR